MTPPVIAKDLDAGGVPFHLELRFSDLLEIEHRLNEGLPTLADRRRTLRFGLREMGAVLSVALRAGWRRDATEADIQDVLDRAGRPVYRTMFLELLTEALTAVLPLTEAFSSFVFIHLQAVAAVPQPQHVVQTEETEEPTGDPLSENGGA